MCESTTNLAAADLFSSDRGRTDYKVREHITSIACLKADCGHKDPPKKGNKKVAGLLEIYRDEKEQDPEVKDHSKITGKS